REAEKAAREATLAQQRAARQIAKARQTAERAGLVPEPATSVAGPAQPASAEAPLPPDLQLLWPRPAASRRGPRPGLTLDGIAAAGVAIADAEGVGAVSMARVAESLGVTTMALYRYVPGKDDLLALMYDVAIGPVPTGPERAVPLRDRLEQWCADQLAMMHAHPWLTDLPAAPRLGPNQLAWLERGMAALADSPLPPAERTQVVGALALQVQSEGLVIAEVARQRRRAAALAEGGSPDGPEVAHPALLDYGSLLRQLTTPQTHPAIAEALEAGGFDDDPVDDDGPGDELAFGPGLAFMLDGIDQLMARAAAAQAAAGHEEDDDA
ncbi:TetR/AcrR family transcriptional regulator, partial [Actinotalea ferrariae]|uniref:TetR/AcrR family transcriptional regulator n=1 Tax=Actinotalea ferrariae TaxID=1386098 RepID=UPI001C8BEBA5